MFDFFVIVFDDEIIGFDLCSEFVKMQKEYLIQFEDVVVVICFIVEDIQLYQVVNLIVVGVMGGGFWGMLVGLIFLNLLVGVVVGVVLGVLVGCFIDIGINDDFMCDLGYLIQLGGLVVFIFVCKMIVDKVLEWIEGFYVCGCVLQILLFNEQEDKLCEVFVGGKLCSVVGMLEVEVEEKVLVVVVFLLLL